MNPAALIACIQINLLRRPLLRLETVCDCLDKTTEQVGEMIDNGELPFAFDLATDLGKCRHIRVLTLCVAERVGWKNPSGPTKNFNLPEVIGLILPARDLRSTELKIHFNCSGDQVYKLAKHFCISRKPTAKDGPESYTVFERSSVATFLEKRRMI